MISWDMKPIIAVVWMLVIYGQHGEVKFVIDGNYANEAACLEAKRIIHKSVTYQLVRHNYPTITCNKKQKVIE